VHAADLRHRYVDVLVAREVSGGAKESVALGKKVQDAAANLCIRVVLDLGVVEPVVPHVVRDAASATALLLSTAAIPTTTTSSALAARFGLLALARSVAAATSALRTSLLVAVVIAMIAVVHRRLVTRRVRRGRSRGFHRRSVRGGGSRRCLLALRSGLGLWRTRFLRTVRDRVDDLGLLQTGDLDVE
jgi:hypothetical protein